MYCTALYCRLLRDDVAEEEEKKHQQPFGRVTMSTREDANTLAVLVSLPHPIIIAALLSYCQSETG